VITFERVTARYPRAGTPSLVEVTADVAAGRVTAVVGPNGSGKTTLVRALLGRVPLVSGRVLLDRDDTHALTRREIARRVAVVVQREEPVFPMRVSEYVALGRHPHLGAWAAATDHEGPALRAAEAAGVAPLLARMTDTLSGGEWQRVRIARALAQESPAVVMDEPTSFLDIGHEMETFELFEGLAAAGRTVLVVSHQLNLVARFAHHVVLLGGGRVVAAGAPDDVMRASVLEAVYDYPLVVARDPAVGAPTLVPLRRPRPLPPSPF
jgi:iron complex transport system ATP-binding protein